MMRWRRTAPKRFAVGAELASTQRVQMFGLEAVQVTGDKGRVRISIRLLYRGNRRFEFRCFDVDRQPEWRCASALSEFRIEDIPESPTEHDAPQVRHLRDVRFGVAFDPPNDSWLSFEPRRAMGGIQVVWLWYKADQQIDVQAMDLAAAPVKPDQATFANQLSEGQHVVKGHSTFAGHVWDHLAMSDDQHGKRDLFVLVEADVMYALLVTQKNRDLRLIEAAKRGFRLIPKSPVAEP